MTDFPINPSPSADSTGKIATSIARLNALLRTACGALTQATARNAQRRAMRRAPEEILAAQARREDARRAVDRLLR